MMHYGHCRMGQMLASVGYRGQRHHSSLKIECGGRPGDWGTKALPTECATGVGKPRGAPAQASSVPAPLQGSWSGVVSPWPKRYTIMLKPIYMYIRRP